MEQDEYVSGLRPGTYRVKFWRSDDGPADIGKDYVEKRMLVDVPACGRHHISVGHESKQPRGHLKRIGCKAVKVKADARAFTAAPRVTYRVVRKPLRGKARQGAFAVAAGQKRSFVVKKPGRAKATVTLKVRRTDGKWVRLDRVRLPRCR